MEKQALSGENLEKVSGGKIVGTTSYGYPVDEHGNVTFTDKVGESIVLSATTWQKMKDYYAYTQGNPEAYIRDVTIKEMKEAGLIPSA